MKEVCLTESRREGRNRVRLPDVPVHGVPLGWEVYFKARWPYRVVWAFCFALFVLFCFVLFVRVCFGFLAGRAGFVLGGSRERVYLNVCECVLSLIHISEPTRRS